MKKNGLKFKGLSTPTSLLILGGLASGFMTLSGQTVLQAELDRRRDGVIAAEESLLAGDTAYQGANFDEAVRLYREAFALISEGETAASLREAARERYAQAAVQAARVKNRSGDRDGAIALVDEVLEKNVYPNYEPARVYRAKLDSPITTNPSATAEHGQKVDEVRRLLYTAEGEYDLGKFDQALATYQKVLRVDPYNKAARRGMERVNAQISSYAGAAYDQARAKLLSDVSGAWELDVPKNTQDLSFGSSGVILEGDRGANIEAKLDEIIIPIVNFEDASLEEAIEYLEAKSRQLDPEVIEQNRGISFVMSMGSGKNSPEIDAILSKRFSFRLRNVPLREVVKYIATQTGTNFSVDSYAVVFRPLSGSTDELIVRRYNVPPTFLSQSSGAAAVDSDPFGDSGASSTRLAPRLTARQYLESMGVPFPEGGSASYTSSLSQLTVKSTAAGQDMVAAVVDALSSVEPIAVVIETKIIRVSQENLEELSFDAVLDGLSQTGDLYLGGGTVGSGIGTSFADGNPITSGLRSGDFATAGDPLQSFLNGDFSVTDTQSAAPGVFSVLGNVNDTGVGILMRALDQKKGVDVMSQPSVVARNGEQATIFSGREMIYPTEYEPPELPNSVGSTGVGDNGGDTGSATVFPVTPATPTAFETRNVGVTLEVQPTVSEDRSTVSLAIAPRVDDFLGFVNYGSPIFSGADVSGDSATVLTSNDILMPIFSSMNLNTTVEVANNRTLLVGGLVSESIEIVEDKVPVLGDLPVLGKFFSSDVNRRVKDVVMIFVTVRIVDPGGNPVQ